MLDWEENLFVGLKALHRRVFVRPEERRREAVRATLKEQRASLLLLAQMIAGRSLAIFETSDPVVCGHDRIFLPSEYSLARSLEGNRQCFRLRSILSALALRETGRPVVGGIAEIARRSAQEFPGLEAMIEDAWLELTPPHDLWTVVGVLPDDGTERPVTAREQGTSQPELKTLTESATEIQGSGQLNVEVLPSPEDDGPGADMPMHTFEKVETLEESGGESRKTDDEDELQEHEEALRELTMRTVIRTPGRPRSIYRSDLILDGLSLEVDGPASGGGIPYPEWDHRRQEHRRDWCWIQESTLTEQRPEWVRDTAVRHRRLIRRLKQQFASLTSDWRTLPRQSTGDEFDIDAVVDSEVDRRSGHTPLESIYLDRRRERHDVAALILLDVSYSTDAWVDNRRVLDVIRETVFCVGEVLEDPIAGFAIAAFSSNTRRSCGFQWIKDFPDSWPAVRSRLGVLEPCGYTRIGPALRHAQEHLVSMPASRKLVLLITDGRPCDYDRYEGLYGIRDVRKAIETGRQQGIQTHAFAIEKQAAEFLPRIFLQHHYDIIPKADRLAGTMCRLFARVLAR